MTSKYNPLGNCFRKCHLENHCTIFAEILVFVILWDDAEYKYTDKLTNPKNPRRQQRVIYYLVVVTSQNCCNIDVHSLKTNYFYRRSFTSINSSPHPHRNRSSFLAVFFVLRFSSITLSRRTRLTALNLVFLTILYFSLYFYIVKSNSRCLDIFSPLIHTDF